MVALTTYPSAAFSKQLLCEWDRRSIETFITEQHNLLQGKTLDFGAGLSPYKVHCNMGRYVPYNIVHPSTPEGAFISEYEKMDAAGQIDALYQLNDDELCSEDVQKILAKLYAQAGHSYNSFGTAAEDLAEELEIPIDDPVLCSDYDAVLCTQVLQYLPQPFDTLSLFRNLLEKRLGFLVMTYPCNWPEDEASDLHRFTKRGVEALLDEVGFPPPIVHEERLVVEAKDLRLVMGYQLVVQVK